MNVFEGSVRLRAMVTESRPESGLSGVPRQRFGGRSERLVALDEEGRPQ